MAAVAAIRMTLSRPLGCVSTVCRHCDIGRETNAGAHTFLWTLYDLLIDLPRTFDFMLTLVRVRPARRLAADPLLAADFAMFQQRRAARAPVVKGCVGFALLIVLGGILGDFSRAQAAVGATLCLAPPAGLALIEEYRKTRLFRRLDRLRAEIQAVRKS